MHRFLLLPLLAAACQPLPHPFAADVPPPSSPVLSPRDSAGIIVAPVAGSPAPISGQLAEAMASALRDAEIPASTAGSGNKGTYRLFATAREETLGGGRSSIAVDWELRAADGKRLGHVAATAEEPSAAWRAGDEATARDVAGKAASALAKLVQDEPPVAVEPAETLVAILPVTGAPGDGGRSLTRAMNDALRRAHVPLAEKPADNESFVLAGRVELSPPTAGKQQVKVSWELLRPDGQAIGHIDQENAVVAGSLSGAWGDVAYAVANAAAPGVTALIARAKAIGIGA
jgi:hypothetical protein